ncbi:MAG TPA: DUF2269 family protein [Gemmatimonadaceae bacterium]|nr:DUF2269 family protein [Gemmatimonadaceae bacterium]
MSWYGVLKVLHVLAAVVWIGGGVMFTMIAARLVRSRDRAALGAVLPQMAGQLAAAGGPAAGTVLLTGIAMVIVGHIGFDTLWVRLGFGGILLHFLFGPFVMRKRTMGLIQAVSVPSADEADVARAGARLRSGMFAYLAIMTSVIVVMVLKPV